MCKRALAPFCLIICLMGCGSGVQSSTLLTFPNLTGNWQIQTDNNAPSNGLLLVGSLTETSSQFSGTFRIVNLASGGSCGSAARIVSLSGSIGITGVITLQSEPFAGASIISISLQTSTDANSPAYGSISISGGSCTYPNSAAVGVNIAAVSGTYSGTVSRFGSLVGAANGTATMTLSQARTPSSDGEFPVNGTIVFSGANCSSSTNVSGTVSGVQLNLASPADPNSGVSEVQVSAAPSLNADQLSGATFTFQSGACASALSTFNSYTGNLSR